MSKTTRLKPIQEYKDYRLFLRDFYLSRKAENPSYSYQWFARKAQLKSPNYLKLVIDGQRRITEEKIDNFVRGLGLVGDDAAQFRCLVVFDGFNRKMRNENPKTRNK